MEEFANLLNKHGIRVNVREFPESTKTSAEAAKAIGCRVSQIAKSIVFRGKSTEMPYLAIVSGPKRASESAIEREVGEEIEKADADFVKKQTGFSIGGVPPAGHAKKIGTFIDKNLMDEEILWAAAGTGNSVFDLTPEELVKITDGRIIDFRDGGPVKK